LAKRGKGAELAGLKHKAKVIESREGEKAENPRKEERPNPDLRKERKKF